MIKPRANPDGLPYRVYERFGARVYSIGYKLPSGRWAYKFRCPVDDANQIRKIRRQAIEESTRIVDEAPAGGFAGLIDAWFEWQEGLPYSVKAKRKDSTIAENKNEAKMLKKAFGHFEVSELRKGMALKYLEANAKAGRPEKANKEIGLARLILEYAIRLEMIEVNPFDKFTKNETVKQTRYVTDEEMMVVVEAGRMMGGPYHIIAMALKTAWLCVRRSFEVRNIPSTAVKEAGMLWTDSKHPTKPTILIEWSPELRSTIAEVQAIERNKDAATDLLFGNMKGQAYTKSGWGKLLGTLMATAELYAEALEIPFEHFSLQDCRPKGVSDKLAAGHTDTQDATLHSDGKMIARIYDRRTNKKATPAG